MKDTLEYKILKYLSENDNGQDIEVSHLYPNKYNLLKKLSFLKNEKYIKARIINNESIIANIEFKGIEYLNQIEKNEIINEIDKLTLNKLKFEQFPSKFWWLIIIIMSFISVLTTWVNNQISKSENQQEQQKTEKSLQK